jgi:hypothetical protein
LRATTALSLVAAVPAVLGGVIFWAVEGGTTATRAIAYGFWFAAALLLLGMIVAGNKRVWRRTAVTMPEGWVFVASAVVLTVAGAAIDAVGV